MSGCDCSANFNSNNYFGSMSNTVQNVPTGDMGYFNDSYSSSLGLGSQEFISGTQPVNTQFNQQNNQPLYSQQNNQQYNQQNNQQYNQQNNQLNSVNSASVQMNMPVNSISNVNPINNLDQNMGPPSRNNNIPAQPPLRNNQEVVNNNQKVDNANANINANVNHFNNLPKNDPPSVNQCSALSKNNVGLAVLIIAGLAWHEVIRVFIVKSIKCGDGSQQYYLYYAGLATILFLIVMNRKN